MNFFDFQDDRVRVVVEDVLIVLTPTILTFIVVLWSFWGDLMLGK